MVGFVLMGIAFSGGIAIGQADSVTGEFDKICYEHNPNWSYEQDSVQYWNDTLSINCVESVVDEESLFNGTEKQVQDTLELTEVKQ